MDGWIKLYRKLLNSPIFENERALKVWIWCLLKATHEDREQLVGRQTIYLKSGEFIFGRKRASEELKMPEKTVYDYIHSLKNLSMLYIKSNNKFSVIGIENWAEYQLPNQDFDNKFDNKRTTNEQQMNTNNNVKNVNNIYLYFINKYKAECSKMLKDKMRFLREIQKEEKYKELTPDEEYDLRDYILKDVR